MESKHDEPFRNSKYTILMIAMVATLIIDISVVKVNDLIDKDFISIQNRLILFAVNSSLCLVLQYFVIAHLKFSTKTNRLNKTLRFKAFNWIPTISLSMSSVLIAFLILQQIYNNYYETSIVICIIIIAYSTAAGLLAWLSWLFLTWYRSNKHTIVLLYFVSTLIISFNLIMAATFTSVKLNDRPSLAGQYIGSSGDISGGRYLTLDRVYIISSFMSFFSIWITTAILMNYYREKLANAIIYWVILSLPLIYFVITIFYEIIVVNVLVSYLELDPVAVSIFMGAFLSLSKPIGGMVFGIAFWKISRALSYEKTIRMYMLISGWGLFLLFSADQAPTQIISPYPPFGIATVTVLSLAAFLMLLGIYNSAVLVSANNSLRDSIRKFAVESKLLGLIGQAEMENEIQKTVSKINMELDKKDILTNSNETIELDGVELRKYIDFVLDEVKKKDKI